jgi:hypothetical protein
VVVVVPTPLRLLVLLAGLAATAGWGLAQVWDSVTGTYLPVPWTAAIGLGALAVALLVWTVLARPRLARKPDTRPLDPIVAARTAALAMAASRTGAVVGGLYLGIAAAFAPILGQEPGRARVLSAGAAVLAAVAVVVVALWLERCCRLPDPPGGTVADEDDGVLRG